jgi:hypothetical protein
MKRTLTTVLVAIVTTLATAGTALAGYPPTNVKGETQVKGEAVQNVAPEQTVAFTGSNTMWWIVAIVALLLIGAALIAYARSTRSVAGG